MADPVSWYAVRRGWRVQALDGTPVGDVADVLGDESLDIFNGLLVSVGIGRMPRYVQSEDVTAIEEGTVTIGVLADEVGSLPTEGP